MLDFALRVVESARAVGTPEAPHDKHYDDRLVGEPHKTWERSTASTPWSLSVHRPPDRPTLSPERHGGHLDVVTTGLRFVSEDGERVWTVPLPLPAQAVEQHLHHVELHERLGIDQTAYTATLLDHT